MIELDIPSLPERELELEPDGGDRGPSAGKGTPPALSGRIVLGGPVSCHLTKAALAEDPELSAFVERKSAYDYYLVHLSLSFIPVPRAPRLATASLQIELRSTDNTPAPIALSMTPVCAANKVHVERGIKIGPELKFLGVEGRLGEASGTESRDEQEVFLEALRLLRHDPGWEFRSTKTTHLSGMFELHLVVRATRGAQAELTCNVTASTRANMVRWYRRSLPAPLLLGAPL